MLIVKIPRNGEPTVFFSAETAAASVSVNKSDILSACATGKPLKYNRWAYWSLTDSGELETSEQLRTKVKLIQKINDQLIDISKLNVNQLKKVSDRFGKVSSAKVRKRQAKTGKGSVLRAKQ